MEFQGLQRSDVIRFLSERLEIPDIEKLASGHQIPLLTAIIRQWMRTLPFHTVKQVAMTSLRRAPTEEEAVADVMSGAGGLCGTHGVALYHVLQALDMNCHMVIGMVGGACEEHVCVLVHDVQDKGDAFLVDTGCGYPAFAPIQIKTAQGYIESIGPISQSFCTYKLIKQGNTYERHQLTRQKKDKVDRAYPDVDEHGYARFCTIQLEPKSYEYIYEQLTRNIYSQNDYKFNRELVLCKYPNDRLVGLRDTTARLEHEPGVITERQLASDDDINQFLQQHFPELPPEMVKEAVKNQRTNKETLKVHSLS